MNCEKVCLTFGAFIFVEKPLHGSSPCLRDVFSVRPRELVNALISACSMLVLSPRLLFCLCIFYVLFVDNFPLVLYYVWIYFVNIKPFPMSRDLSVWTIESERPYNTM